MNIALLKAELTRDEGVRLRPYKDTVGKTTIGVGRNLDDVGISPEEVDFLLMNDINGQVIPALTRYFPWYSTMNDARQRVLANMIFNMGHAGVQKFQNMLAAMQAGDFDKAADEMLDSLWAKQVGQRAERLAETMRNGT